ncbi:hypothetical protein [Bacillus toyonensis]|uniref:Uncharacterized protein n=1 Tax=Bacillus toyonensis TaxID=155322 RepID=A0A2B5EWA7_9BACI|nr:hypothetical protein [Bacillus toyonensis]PEB22591.1 hypothetical protein COO05_21280 [Bacillus toyonensis]PEJ87850.1 hypothetical protein CN688_28135 [Bacillus toyonensis]PEK70403.1 hypothetical protein CN594_35100 [Bacillus toyonensis]PEL15973.1 hypothetical protein CN624_31020 [Bacillus toyonensis]PEO06551.1 hypothetical protein CN561_04510 [Bacillus toyonensis]
MFKKLAIGTFAIGIMLSGVTGVSAAQINNGSLISDIYDKRDDDRECSWVKNEKFSKLYDTEEEIPETTSKKVNGKRVTGDLVCYYNTGSIGFVAYYK